MSLPTTLRETAEMLTEYPSALVGSDGAVWIARVWGARRDDGLWEGWLEFERVDTAGARAPEIIHTGRETTQPNRADLLYWACGLTPVYLEGAFQRIIDEP